jgi:hypothetical protein
MGIISKAVNAFGFGKDAKERVGQEKAQKERLEAIKQAKDLKAYVEYSTKRLKEHIEKSPLHFYATPYDRLLLEHEVDIGKLALDFRVPECEFYSEIQLEMLYEMERQKDYELYMILTVILIILAIAFSYGVWL